MAGVAGVQACLPLGRLPAVLVALFLAALIILAAFLAALIRKAFFIFAALMFILAALSRAALFVLFILAALVLAALVVLAAVIRAVLFILVTMGRFLLLQFIRQWQKCCEVGGWRGAPLPWGAVATVRALWSCGWRC